MKGNREELIKVINILNWFWDIVFIDYGGLYLDGYYNFVLIDKRIRYLVVELVLLIDF